MTHPNLQTNGASLEDCHTNFFALVSAICFPKTTRQSPECVSDDKLAFVCFCVRGKGFPSSLGHVQLFMQFYVFTSW